jgi:hypothetical protein
VKIAIKIKYARLLPGAKLACCGVVINRAMQRKSRRDDRRDRQA